jgi:hypothetical protein
VRVAEVPASVVLGTGLVRAAFEWLTAVYV